MDTTSIRMPVPENVEYSGYAVAEESLVADSRAGLTPSQMVERKLVSLLKSNPLPVSQISSGRRPSRDSAEPGTASGYGKVQVPVPTPGCLPTRR